ncbi:MAG: carbamoyltransferase C-terminal domain-containing protein, partial [Rhodospirillales bacterium]|nr:carbamoyltransferase C-terminal domain-containing protein [Rhodospirillales bacterium]
QVAVKREATFSVGDHIREQEDYWKPLLIDGEEIDYLAVFKDKLQFHNLNYDFGEGELKRSDFQRFRDIRQQTIKTHLGIGDDRIHCLNHHYAHSMYAIFSNPACFDKDWLVLVADGYGDDCSASVGIWQGGSFEFVAKSIGSGIGRIYRSVTLLLGMRPGVDEFKVMGLAPYAKPYHWQAVADVLHRYLRVEGMEIDYTNPDKDLYFSLKEKLKEARFDGIAGGLQKFSEDITIQWTANSIRQTGIRNIAFSGGVAMNIKINQAVMDMEEVEDIFIGPSGGDESLSMGVAYALWFDKFSPSKQVKPLTHAYLGPSYNAARSEAALGQLGDGFQIQRGPSAGDVAALLAEGKILGRAVGPMEFGARALGNRSILARADDPAMIRNINDRIKRRDFWMPFAPIILAECMEDYLVNPKAVISPYMTLGFDSTPLGRDHLRAALHPADDTSRPQIVARDQNPELHALLKEFQSITGIGGLLNTSLNLHGEPICCTPEDSIQTLVNSELDGLLLEGYLVLRR